jgi:murein DD-endopeptidase MepM/ murein hydrolase activator NlpD
LRRVRTIRGASRAVAIVTVLFGASIGVGYGVPAYAQALTPAKTGAGGAGVKAGPERHVFQKLDVPLLVAAPPISVRDNYSVTHPPPPLVWPVPAATPISDGFGQRVSPCAGCSSDHEGVDFDPGDGALVHAIAAGVVVETNSPGYAALGVHVAIQHLIDGKTVVSAYGHLQTGSMQLKVGDRVTVGQVVGLVGGTGASTGPHLHFEIRTDGTVPVDPMAWMHAELG